MESLYIYTLIAVFFPLLGSLIVGLNCRIINNNLAHSITSIMIFVSAIFSFKVLTICSCESFKPFEKTLYIWGNICDIKFEIGFLIDRLTAIMMFVVSFISFLIHIYTIGYMHKDPGYNRFFSYISFFTFAMLMLVVSNNFLQLFFGWEAVGLASYLLIGFWFKRESAVFANLKAFIVNRVGDFGFLLGIAAVFCCFNTLNYNKVFLNIDNILIENATFLNTFIQTDNVTAITFITVCLFIGAMGKSAQVPLHVWLPDSMEGPTPISALIHAATMVTAGIFMVARMSPLFEYSQTALTIILLVGTITCFFMGILGIVQNDIKRVVAYSTLSQLGLMVAALGASAYSAAIFHLVTHAFFKALLFLGAGSVIIALHHEQDIRYMGNLKKYMPITYISMLIGSLALSGMPGFSGFFSKDLIIEYIHLSKMPYSELAYYCVISGVFITSFYSFRMFFLVFHTNERIDKHAKPINESPYVVTIPLIILSFFAIFSGWMFFNKILNNYFDSAIFIKNTNITEHIIIEVENSQKLFLHGFKSLPFFVSLSGILLAWYFYCINQNIVKIIKKKLNILHKILINKYGFDAFNQYFIAFNTKLSGNILWKFGDMFLIDKLLVHGMPLALNYFSLFLKKIQTGRIYNYVYIMITGFLALMLGLLNFVT